MYVGSWSATGEAIMLKYPRYPRYNFIINVYTYRTTHEVLIRTHVRKELKNTVDTVDTVEGFYVSH